MQPLLQQIRKCTICEPHLELGVRPVLSADVQSKILIIGQAPGLAVHQTGIPWDDKSGKNLRNWMDVDNDTFYDPTIFGIIPMGFCYPGKGKSGDLPPRKECAQQWHQAIWNQLPNVRLTLLIGKYAQDYYLPKTKKRNLTETVKNFRDYLPHFFVLPHPSPRNNIWQAKNKWFKIDVLPALKDQIQQIIIE